MIQRYGRIVAEGDDDVAAGHGTRTRQCRQSTQAAQYPTAIPQLSHFLVLPY
jgi:hypothetical protein